MKLWSSIIVATGLVLSAINAHAEYAPPVASDYYLTMSKFGACLNTHIEGKLVRYCETDYLTVEMKQLLADAKKAETSRFDEIMKPDPLTPKLNACLEGRHFPSSFDWNICWRPLSEDVSALAGFFTKGERAEAAERSGDARMAEMEKSAAQAAADRMQERIDRRANQTPLQNAIDKLNAPCLYADSNNVMRSCD